MKAFKIHSAAPKRVKDTVILIKDATERELTEKVCAEDARTLNKIFRNYLPPDTVVEFKKLFSERKHRPRTYGEIISQAE